MTNYSFFIIIDTNDPSSFHIEMTKMNYRLRFSALKSNHIRKYGENEPVGIHSMHSHECTLNYTSGDSLPGYHKILRSNYTFYLLDKLNVIGLTSLPPPELLLESLELQSENLKFF